MIRIRVVTCRNTLYCPTFEYIWANCSHLSATLRRRHTQQISKRLKNKATLYSASADLWGAMLQQRLLVGELRAPKRLSMLVRPARATFTARGDTPNTVLWRGRYSCRRDVQHGARRHPANSLASFGDSRSCSFRETPPRATSRALSRLITSLLWWNDGSPPPLRPSQPVVPELSRLALLNMSRYWLSRTRHVGLASWAGSGACRRFCWDSGLRERSGPLFRFAVQIS